MCQIHFRKTKLCVFDFLSVNGVRAWNSFGKHPQIVGSIISYPILANKYFVAGASDYFVGILSHVILT